MDININTKGFSKRHPVALFLSIIVLGVLLCSTSEAKVVTLGEVLQQVEHQAPALKAAKAQVDVFKAKRNIGKSRFLGEINLFARDLHFNDNRLTRPISPPINFSNMTFDDNQFGYGIDVLLPIDLNGQIRNSFHALTHQTKAVKAQAANVRLSLLYKAAELYRGLEQISGQREALQKQQQALKEHIKVATTAVEVGRIANVEKLRLIAELKTIEGKLAGLDGKEAGLRAHLASLLNIDAFTDSISITTNLPQPISLPADSISLRPDIIAVTEQEEAAHSAVKAAWGAFFPKIVAAANWQQNQGYNGSGTDDATWQVTIQAKLPLWNGGRRRATISQAKAQRKAAQYQLQSLRDNAVAELISARGVWDAAKAQYEAALSAIQAAEEVTRIQTERFNQGRLSATDLVDAEASLAFARSELTTSLVRWWKADDSLRKAIGQPPFEYAHKFNDTVK